MERLRVNGLTKRRHLNTTHLGVSFDVRSSGQPVLLIENRTSMVLQAQPPHGIATRYRHYRHHGAMAGSTVAIDNKQVLAYPSGTENKSTLPQQRVGPTS